MANFSWALSFFYSQFFITPPKPTKSFAGQTVIVTGSNTGLGLEAARHITSLNATKVILAVRTISKGEAAKKSIEASTGRTGVVEVWFLDLSSYESVKQFAARASKELQRVDILLENAGMINNNFEITEEDESTVTTNVVSTFLLALLMLPKLRETSQRFNTVPRLTIVSSDIHFLAKFAEKDASNIFDRLNDKEMADMPDRYAVTKVMEILIVRHLANMMSTSSQPKVILNTLTPGLCRSDFFRDETNPFKRFAIGLAQRIVGRTAKVGSRTLVAGAVAGEESHGKYMADGVVSHESLFVQSGEGKAVGEKVWGELMGKLERVSPGIGTNV